MTDNFHDPHEGDRVVINDSAVTFNRPLGELDQSITDFQAGDVPFTEGIRVGAGTDEPTALWQLDSTTQSWGVFTLTTAQRDAIVNPPVGLMIFNSTTKVINYYNGSTWKALGTPTVGMSAIASGTFSAASSTSIGSIPSTYQDLILYLTISPDAADAGQQLLLRFNGDTASNYAYSETYDTTGAAVVTHSFSASGILPQYMNQKTSNAANVQAHFRIHIHRYKDAVPKPIFWRGGWVLSGATRAYSSWGSGMWFKSGFDAITSLSFASNGGVNTSGKYALFGRY